MVGDDVPRGGCVVDLADLVAAHVKSFRRIRVAIGGAPLALALARPGGDLDLR
jgi:hypothetical protein